MMSDSDVSGANVRPLPTPAGGNPDDNRSTAAILAEIQECAHVAHYCAGFQLLRDHDPDLEDSIATKLYLDGLHSYLSRRAHQASSRTLELVDVLGRRLCGSLNADILTEDEKRDLDHRY